MQIRQVVLEAYSALWVLLTINPSTLNPKPLSGFQSLGLRGLRASGFWRVRFRSAVLRAWDLESQCLGCTWTPRVGKIAAQNL